MVTPEVVSPIEAGTPLPELNFPDPKFLKPNSNIPMHQPDAKNADNTLPPPAPAIPVETLIESNKPEKPLIIESGSTGFGSGGGAINGGASSGAPASAAPSAPQQ